MSTENDKNIFLLGERLREERDRLGLTQDNLGEKIGRDRATLRNWESGKGSPPLAILLLLHDLGFDVYYILTGTRSPLGVEQQRAEYLTPARRVAAEIAAMTLSAEDAELILNVARRLAEKNKAG